MYSHRADTKNVYAVQFSLGPSVYPHILELVRAFEKRAGYPVKFEDINSIYKEGIELISEEPPGSKSTQSLVSSPIAAATATPTAKDQLFTIKGPFVRFPPRTPLS